jgi:hypothetical protein
MGHPISRCRDLERRPNARQRSPMLDSLPEFLSEISFSWCRRVTFEVFVAEMPRGYGTIAYLFSGGRFSGSRILT